MVGADKPGVTEREGNGASGGADTTIGALRAGGDGGGGGGTGLGSALTKPVVGTAAETGGPGSERRGGGDSPCGGSPR